MPILNIYLKKKSQMGFVYNCKSSKSLMNLTISGFYHRVMFIAPSSDHSLLTLNLSFKVILRKLRLCSNVWNENAADFKRLMKIHLNPPVLYYGFKGMGKLCKALKRK